MHFKMSSAICFNLDQSKILSSGNGLSLYQTVQSFKTFGDKFENTLMTPSTKPFENIVGKGENPGNQHFLLFPQ